MQWESIMSKQKLILRWRISSAGYVVTEMKQLIIWYANAANLLKKNMGCPRGVIVKAMDCGIVVREFVLQSRYYVHFRANTLLCRIALLMEPLSITQWTENL